MTDDINRPPDLDMGEDINDDPGDLPLDIACGIWGDIAARDASEGTGESRPDPVARFKDRLLRVTSQRSDSQ